MGKPGRENAGGKSSVRLAVKCFLPPKRSIFFVDRVHADPRCTAGVSPWSTIFVPGNPKLEIYDFVYYGKITIASSI